MMHHYKGQWRRLIAVAILFVLAAGTSLAQWTQLAPLSNSRGFAMQAIVGTKLYMFGGQVVSQSFPNGLSVDSSAVLDLANPTAWQSIAKLPQNRYGGYAAAVNGKIYIIGGFTLPVGSTAYVVDNSVLEYDPVANTYTPKANVPTAVALFSGAVVNNKIYTIGGIKTGGSTFGNDVQVYDPATNGWTTSTAFPNPVYAGSSVGMGNDIYMIGGSAGSQGVYLTTYKGTISGGAITWTRLVNFPFGIQRAAAGTLNGKVYIAGGQGNTGTETFYYDAASNTWKQYFPVPMSANNFTSFPNDASALYLVSGYPNINTYKLIEGAPKAIADMPKTAIALTVKRGTSQSVDMTIRNSGTAALTGNVTAAGAPWLTGNNFNVPPFSSGKVRFTINATTLANGKHTATATVNTNDASHPTFAVEFVVFVVDDFAAKQAPRVLIEEGSGTRCPPCKVGADTMVALYNDFKEKIVGIGYHSHQGGSPPGAATDELHFGKVPTVLGRLDLGGFPNGAINRVTFEGETGPMVGTTAWRGYIEQAISEQMQYASIAITIPDLQYNEATKTVTGTATLTTVQPIRIEPGTTVRLHLVVTQDSINLPQTDGSRFITPFYHRHASRAIADVTGMELDLSGATFDGNYIAPGTVLTRTFAIDVQADVSASFGGPRGSSSLTPVPFDAAHAELVAFVSLDQDANAGPVLQGQEFKLKAGSSAAIDVTTGDESMTIPAQDSAVFAITVKSNRPEELSLVVQRTANNLPSGWASKFCFGTDCFPESSNQEFTALDPMGNMIVYLKVYGNTPGQTGTVTMKFETDGATVTKTFTVNTTVSGIDDDAVTGNAFALSAFPNPTSNATRLGFTLPQAGVANIELFNLKGEKVYSKSEGRLEAGDHTIVLDMSTLPTGAYTAIVSVNGKKASSRVTVAR